MGQFYRVLMRWSDRDSSKQAGKFDYSDDGLAKAKALSDKKEGYLVWSDGGIPMYPLPFEISPSVSLAVFESWKSDAGKVGSTGKGTFTIIEVRNSRGRLKSGVGWVALKDIPVQVPDAPKAETPDYLAAVAKQAPIVYDKIVALHCKHKSGTKSWDALLKNKYINCSGAVSIVLQRAGIFPKNCILNHRSAVGSDKAVAKKNAVSKAMSGNGKLISGTCDIVKIGKKYSNMPDKYKRAGIVYVQDSNICISAGNGYIYSCNEAANQMKNGKYSCTKVKSGYPFSSPILFAVVPN